MALVAASAVLRTSLTATSAALRTALIAPPTAGPFPILAPDTLQVSPLAIAAVLGPVSGRAVFPLAAAAATASLGGVTVHARFPVIALAASGTLGDVSGVAPGLAEVSPLAAAASLGPAVPRTVFPVAALAGAGAGGAVVSRVAFPVAPLAAAGALGAVDGVAPGRAEVSALAAQAAVGPVVSRATFPVAGLSAQGTLADVSGVSAVTVAVDALAAEAALGEAVARVVFPVAALAGAGSLGEVQPRVSFPVAALAATGTLGAAVPRASFPVAAVAGEGTLGAVDGVPSGAAPDLSPIWAATVGTFLDGTDKSRMWQDAAGTVAVTADGDPVRRVDDATGQGFNWTAPSDAARFTYREGAGLTWLEQDRINDTLNATIDSRSSDFSFCLSYNTPISSILLGTLGADNSSWLGFCESGSSSTGMHSSNVGTVASFWNNVNPGNTTRGQQWTSAAASHSYIGTGARNSSGNTGVRHGIYSTGGPFGPVKVFGILYVRRVLTSDERALWHAWSVAKSGA